DPENLILEIPGRTDKWIVLCAHYDGHRLAESAMDNGSGVAAVLEVARRIAPHAESMEFGLRVMLFTFEEWGLAGSKQYVDKLSDSERDKISAVVNLDTIVGHDKLCALTSESQELETFLTDHNSS